MDAKPCPFAVGDYVLATKYTDGDPGDHFCVGFYAGCYDHFGQMRHMVNDADGKPFRGNGFRRCEKISDTDGRWLIARFEQLRPMEISNDGECLVGKSVWDWLTECRHGQ